VPPGGGQAVVGGFAAMARLCHAPPPGDCPARGELPRPRYWAALTALRRAPPSLEAQLAVNCCRWAGSSACVRRRRGCVLVASPSAPLVERLSCGTRRLPPD
jgi:hypothetical protein